jgi:predicted kinase
MTEPVKMAYTAADLSAIYKDRHNRELPPAAADQLLDQMRVKLAHAMEWGGYEVVIDYLWDYEQAREEAEEEGS